MSRSGRNALLCGVLSSLACGSSSSQGSPGGVQVIVTTTITGRSALIGAEGGTLLTPESVRVTIPPGALTEDTLVEVVPSALPPPLAMTPLSPAYDFLPTSLSFLNGAAATIELPLPANATVAVVYLQREGGTGWDLVGGASWGGSIKARVAHFGTAFAGTPQ